MYDTWTIEYSRASIKTYICELHVSTNYQPVFVLLYVTYFIIAIIM